MILLKCKMKNLLSISSILIFSLAIKAQGILINSGGRIESVSTATIEIINGNFNNNGTFIMGNGNLIFSGTITDSIKGISNNDFYNLTVSDINGVTLASSRYIAINNTLIFSTGLLNTDNNYITINNNATVIGAGINKYINGNCRKVGNDAFVFPVGKSGKYAPIGISAPQDQTDHFTAAYFNSDPNLIHSALLLDVSLNKISRLEYWVLNQTNGNSNIKVTLSWDITSRVSQISDLRVTRWLVDKWIDKGNSATTGNNSLGTISASANATNFSAVDDNLFTLGSSTSVNPLPVDLLYFKADCNNNKVNIKWSTASEINCDYFLLEKMMDDGIFYQFAKVNGNGNSNQLINYKIEDNSTENKISYYKLRQFDFSGNENELNNNIIVSNCNNISNEFAVFQDNEILNIVYNCKDETFAQIHLFDLNGRMIRNITKILSTMENKISIKDFNLSSGLYLFNVETQDKSKAIKIIVR